MTPEKDKELCEKYPEIFKDRYSPRRESCMSFGCDVGDGWFDLLDVLCGQVQHHVDHLFERQTYLVKSGQMKSEDVKSKEHFQVVAAQVKEKFGGLRFYVHGADPEVLGMISMAESMSYRICEQCGNPARSNNDGGWIHTLCSPCRSKYKEIQAKRWASVEAALKKDSDESQKVGE